MELFEEAIREMSKATMMNDDKVSKTDQGMIAKVEQYMKQAGISTGYIKKPCLNPMDQQCPETAPNKDARHSPDIGAALSGGCYGYAVNFMHWPEELIVGGSEKNSTNHIRKAKALQTVVQLMSEQELYDHWNDNYKTHYAGWSLKKARDILSAWQEKFSDEVRSFAISRKSNSSFVGFQVRKLMREEGNTTYAAFDFNAFSSTTLNNSLRLHSKPDLYHLTICAMIILIYTGIVLYRFGDPVNGQSGVGMFGVLLLCMSTAAGLGVCSLLGIPFNVATTQVVPLIALGLAVDQIFILTHGYDSRRNSNEQMHTAQILKKYGLTVMFNGASTATAFIGAALLPIPVLRAFALQAAILITINLVTVLFVFPAFITLDLRRRRSSHMDILCCLPRFMSPVSQMEPLTMNNMKTNNLSKNETLLPNPSKPKKCSQMNVKLFCDFILSGKVKTLGVLTIAALLGSSVYATLKLQDGFELTDLIPKNTSEYSFISAQSKLFGFYNIFAVTQANFEYPQNQKLLREYHESFIRVPNIIKNDNGGLPDFWLNIFRNWLLTLQAAFDRDYASGAISKERWYANASVDGVLAFKLLAQTGHVDNPIDKSLITHNRLVDAQGIINPKAFYNYLSAWAWNDAAYGASQSNLRPPPRMWIHSPKDKHMEIPKSAPLTYTQLPFYLHGLYTTKDIKMVIEEIRELCNKFSARGLPNYPSGIPFLYWAQYFNLDLLIFIALGLSILVTFILAIIFLQSLSAALLIITNAIFVFTQMFGVMLLLDVKLSAIAAVVLIASIGLSICFTANITLVGF
jgi:patched 1